MRAFALSLCRITGLAQAQSPTIKLMVGFPPGGVVKNPGFDPARDFAAVAGFATFVNAFAVSGGTPAKTMAEYAAWVRSQGQGKGTVGVPAPASVPEFLIKLIGQKYQLDLQAAPYRGSAPLISDMLGNQIGVGVASVPDFIENHKAGKVRVVAVLGGARQAALPEVRERLSAMGLTVGYMTPQ